MNISDLVDMSGGKRKRGMSPETEHLALIILTDISVAPMKWEDICSKYGISRSQWKQTYKPAVRQLAKDIGLFVPRPVPSDGYLHRAIDEWQHDVDGVEESAAIRNGFLHKLQDEYTRTLNSLQHVEAAIKGAVRTQDVVLATSLQRLRDLDRGRKLIIESIGQELGISLTN